MRAEFFLPIWRRIAVVVICFGWAIFELTSGAPYWALLFGAFGATATWQFFLSGWPENQGEKSRND